MTIKSENLGYREAHRLAEFIMKISDTGIPEDVAKNFYYDFYNDEAVCETVNGAILRSDED